MAVDLTNRHFVKEIDFTPAEWMGLVGWPGSSKRRDAKVVKSGCSTCKTIALIFEKTSTRTRCAFEVAAYHLGAQLTYLDPHGSQIGHKESFADTGRVLGRLYDAIEFRGSRHEDCETLARYAGVPVYNGLTDTWHPTQALCDIVTMVEHTAKPAGRSPTPMSGMPATTWATRCSLPVPCRGWTCGSSRPGNCGRARRSSDTRVGSPMRPALASR
jgi:ornithine carbamoyltransferase